MAQALTFELGKVDIPDIRKRVLGHLTIIDRTLADTVADGLGMAGEAVAVRPAAQPIDLDPSPALRLYGKYKPTLKGRKVGVLLGPGFEVKTKNALVAAIKKEGATPAIIGPRVGGVEDSSGAKQPVEMALRGSPSVFFDAVAVVAGPAGDKAFSADPDAVAFLMDACRHLKAIGLSGVPELAAKAQVVGLVGITDLDKDDVSSFLEFARNGKVWDREKA